MHVFIKIPGMICNFFSLKHCYIAFCHQHHDNKKQSQYEGRKNKTIDDWNEEIGLKTTTKIYYHPPLH